MMLRLRCHISCDQYKVLLQTWLSSRKFSTSNFNCDTDKVGLDCHISSPLPRYPNHDVYEKLWYKCWEDNELFTPKKVETSSSRERKYFSMILPPPNITGNLHLGHAMTVTIQDAIYRYHRMKGQKESVDCVWIPGYDHAGIATQLILHKMLLKRKNVTSTNLIEASEFESFARQWKQDRVSDIRSQMKHLGASLDFSREFFTLSTEMSKAVNEAFIRLHDEGVIFRKYGVVNWSFHLQSTLSDIEINWLQFDGPRKISVPGYEKTVEFGTLHSFAYKFYDNPDKEIVVSTTRIETMVGDTGVAVNPDDPRYANVIGKFLSHPLTGQKIPIIADKRIEKDFGTGAMKVTPSHSPTDFELGQAHGLRLLNIFDKRGCIECPELLEKFSSINGINRFDAKERIVDVLQELGLYRGVQDHKTIVPVCARSGDVIESTLLPQWFVNHKLLVDDVRQALEAGDITVSPPGHKASWLKWLNSADWCISRQIAWGHQIPAYRVFVDGEDTGTWVAAANKEEAFVKAAKPWSVGQSTVTVVQDKDVLDTWFSSALLPFSALGWPDTSSDDFKRFYPLSLMETGFDILGFWVSRMAVLSKRLTGEFAFKKVLLHGMVCDSFGKKMTKSLGNVIDPLDVIEGVSIDELLEKSRKYHTSGLLTEDQLERAQNGQKKLFPNGMPSCGADALRLSLLTKNVRYQVLRLSVKNIAHNRHFINKMWQTYRFFVMNLEKKKPANHKWIESLDELYIAKQTLSPANLWILSELEDFVQLCNNSMDSHDFHEVYAAMNEFLVDKFCNKYLEQLIKPVLRGNDDKEATDQQRQVSDALNVFHLCLKTTLLCIHPLTPFISEELYQRLRAITKIRTSKIGASAELDNEEQVTSIIEELYPEPGKKKWKLDSEKDEETGAV